MKNHFSLALLALTMCFISCSNDDNTMPEPEENFYALTVGNSWVYAHQRRIGQSEQFENINVIDSVKIIGTEEINGETFYTFRTRTSGNENNQAFCSPNGEHLKRYRDSLGYLINESGKVFYSRDDNQEFLIRRNLSFYLYTALAEGNEMISTTAGDFECQRMEVYAREAPGTTPLPGLDRYYFAPEMGIISNTSSYANNHLHTVERSLLSYNVQ